MKRVVHDENHDRRFALCPMHVPRHIGWLELEDEEVQLVLLPRIEQEVGKHARADRGELGGRFQWRQERGVSTGKLLGISGLADERWG